MRLYWRYWSFQCSGRGLDSKDINGKSGKYRYYYHFWHEIDLIQKQIRTSPFKSCTMMARTLSSFVRGTLEALLTKMVNFQPLFSQIIKSTLNPEWPPEKVTVEELCNGDLNRKLLIEVFDWDKVGKHDLIGRFTVRRTFRNWTFRPLKLSFFNLDRLRWRKFCVALRSIR